MMKIQNFSCLQLQLDKVLAPLMGLKQSHELESRAQKICNKLFAKNRTLGRRTLIETSGIEVTGCVLHFDIGSIGVSRWLTQFYTKDKHEVYKSEREHVALGYVNDKQIYVAYRLDTKPLLVVNDGYRVETWEIQKQGLPPQDTEFMVALGRAKALGYLSDLTGE